MTFPRRRLRDGGRAPPLKGRSYWWGRSQQKRFIDATRLELVNRRSWTAQKEAARLVRPTHPPHNQCVCRSGGGAASRAEEHAFRPFVPPPAAAHHERRAAARLRSARLASAAAARGEPPATRSEPWGREGGRGGGKDSAQNLQISPKTLNNEASEFRGQELRLLKARTASRTNFLRPGRPKSSDFPQLSN